MVNKLRDLAIFEERDIGPFLNYLDPNLKGYVTFREFSDKLRVGTIDNNN